MNQYFNQLMSKGREPNCKRISVLLTVFNVCFYFSSQSKGCVFKWVLRSFQWIFTTYPYKITAWIHHSGPRRVYGAFKYSSRLFLPAPSYFFHLQAVNVNTKWLHCEQATFLAALFTPRELAYSRCQETNSDLLHIYRNLPATRRSEHIIQSESRRHFCSPNSRASVYVKLSVTEGCTVSLVGSYFILFVSLLHWKQSLQNFFRFATIKTRSIRHIQHAWVASEFKSRY